MTIKRTISCNVCGSTAEEVSPEQGWPGWGAIHGVALNGVTNPNLCPLCLVKVMEFIDTGAGNGMD